MPIFYAGRKIAGAGVGAAAAWFWALFPNAIMIPYEWIWDTCLTTLLATFILWFTLELAESRRAIDWCLYGLLWGFALLTNPALGTLLPFLLGWAAYRAKSVRNAESGPRRARGLDAGALLHALDGAELCRLPSLCAAADNVSLRALARTQPRLRPAIAPDDAGDSFEEGREYKRLGEDAFMRTKWIEAVHFITRTHPALEASLFEQRFVAFWCGLIRR